MSARPDFAQMRVAPTPARIRLRRVGFDDVWLVAELRRPAIPDLPPELQKIRITADFLDCVAAEGRGHVKLSFANEEPRSLPALRALLDVLAMFDAGPVDMSVYRDGALLTVAELSVPPAQEPLARPGLSLALSCLEAVAGRVAPDDLAISLIDLHAARHAILAFSDLTSAGELTADLQFAGPPAPGLETSARLIAFGSAEVGGWTFMAIVSRPITQLEMGEASLHFACGEPVVVEAMARRGTAAEQREGLETLYRATVDALGADTLELFGGDFAAMQAGLAAG